MPEQPQEYGVLSSATEPLASEIQPAMEKLTTTIHEEVARLKADWWNGFFTGATAIIILWWLKQK